MAFLMAIKNMFRYKRRTVITAGAIAAGVLFAVVMDSLLLGMDKDSQQNLVDYETSAAKIYASGYFAERELYPANYLIETEDKQTIEALLEKNGVKGFTPRYTTFCEIYFQEDFFDTAGSVSGILYGIDPGRDKNVFKTASGIVSGRWLTQAGQTQDGNADEGVVIGSWLASDIGAEVGYYVTIQCKGRGGFYQTFDVPVIGIVQTENPTVNASAVFMSLEYLDNVLELDGAVTEYDVSLGSLAAIDGQFRKLETAFALESDANGEAVRSGLELYKWDVLVQDLVTLIQSKSQMSKLMLLFLFIIAAVGVSNTMLMAVMERKNEIAMLKSLGYSNVYVRCLFMYEGICIGIVGCAAGIILGLLINWPLVVYGLDFSAASGQMDIGYRISSVMRSCWNPASYAAICAGAVAISAFSAWFPAGRILRKEIADIFRSI